MIKPKILVVEDDSSIVAMYQFKLEHEGYTVKTAGNGKIALETLATFRPDIILLDLKMPVMSGDVMLKKLRQEPWGHTIRVIILTNISKDEAPQKLRLLGVDRYVVKAHHTPKQVVEIIEEVYASSKR